MSSGAQEDPDATPFDTWERKTGRSVSQETRVLRLGSSTKRYVYGYSDGGRMHLGYAYWVRAFWRDQWYPSLRQHKPKLILPYIKGDWRGEIRNPERMFLPPRRKSEE